MKQKSVCDVEDRPENSRLGNKGCLVEGDMEAVGLMLCLEGVREVNTRIGCGVAQATENVYICVEIGMWLKMRK